MTQRGGKVHETGQEQTSGVRRPVTYDIDSQLAYLPTGAIMSQLPKRYMSNRRETTQLSSVQVGKGGRTLCR